MEKIIEGLQKKYLKATNALATLKIALDDMKNVNTIAKNANEYPEKIYKTFRDSLIQRFEYTFDLTWKFLGAYLEADGNILEIKTPKAIFRETLKTKHLTDDQVRLAMEMVDHRNLTTHGYDEQIVEIISAHIPQYYQLMESILQKIVLRS
jgi:nucleotidyltransferase substrate binding protein (TIGR01987 family)